MDDDGALALDEARIEDSVTCEGCGATFDVAEIVLSPYEADDGGAYCTDCATREWARLVEECDRLRRAVALALDGPSDGEVGMETTMGRLHRIERQLRAALALAAGEGDDDAGE